MFGKKKSEVDKKLDAIQKKLNRSRKLKREELEFLRSHMPATILAAINLLIEHFGGDEAVVEDARRD